MCVTDSICGMRLCLVLHCLIVSCVQPEVGRRQQQETGVIPSNDLCGTNTVTVASKEVDEFNNCCYTMSDRHMPVRVQYNLLAQVLDCLVGVAKDGEAPVRYQHENRSTNHEDTAFPVMVHSPVASSQRHQVVHQHHYAKYLSFAGVNNDAEIQKSCHYG